MDPEGEGARRNEQFHTAVDRSSDAHGLLTHFLLEKFSQGDLAAVYIGEAGKKLINVST